MNIVFIGDSLTAWFDWQKRFPRHSVLNLGLPGETVEELLDRRQALRSQIQDPDRIFVMTGINNVLSEQYDITAPYSEFVRNLATWYKSAVITVQSILPVDVPWISNDAIRLINCRLTSIAEEQRAEYLDIYRSFVDPADQPKAGFLSDDGVHLATRGYEVWALEVEAAILQRAK